MSASNFVELVFLCIGWTFDMSGKKASEFASEVTALGAIVDLQDVPRGIIRVRNTEKRIHDLSSIISNISAVGKLGHLEAQQLRGKLTFADNQVHGRMGPLLMKALSEHIHATSFTSVADDTLLTALARMKDRIAEGESREIRAVWDQTVYIFSDAFFEPSDSPGGLAAGLGAVIYDSEGRILSWYSKMLEPDLLEKLLGPCQKTFIYELEFLAVTLSWMIWKERLQWATVMCFIDNNGVKDSTIRGRTDNAVPVGNHFDS